MSDKVLEAKKLLDEIEMRDNYYKIVEVDLKKVTDGKKYYPQLELIKELTENDTRYILYQGGNGAGKTFIGAYATIAAATNGLGKKYNIPYLGKYKNIWIVTKSGANVKTTIEPYLLGNKSSTRIPPELIDGNPHYDNKILKDIKLINGVTISVLTYDQGAERLQGGNPDFIWLDEEPRDEEVVQEILFRTRNKNCVLLITMTPLGGYTPIYDFFYNQEDEDKRNKSKIFSVNSLWNSTTDKTVFKGLDPDVYKMRVEGTFTPPTGLVYNRFHKNEHILDMDIPGEVRHYRTIDFGVSHPTAALFIAVDQDENVIVYDEIYESDLLIENLHRKILEKSGNKNFEYTIGDSAAKRERLELQKLGILTVPADKFSKGENQESNRKSGILKVNQMFYNNKLFIHPRCVNTIRELTSHYYKEGGKKDGEVVKVNDDALDALRYFIFGYRPPKYVSERKSKIIEKMEKNKSVITNNNPY